MPWTEKQQILSRLGLQNFQSEEHFDHWYKWELQDISIKNRITKALNDGIY